MSNRSASVSSPQAGHSAVLSARATSTEARTRTASNVATMSTRTTLSTTSLACWGLIESCWRLGKHLPSSLTRRATKVLANKYAAMVRNGAATKVHHTKSLERAHHSVGSALARADPSREKNDSSESHAAERQASARSASVAINWLRVPPEGRAATSCSIAAAATRQNRTAMAPGVGVRVSLPGPALVGDVGCLASANSARCPKQSERHSSVDVLGAAPGLAAAAGP